LRLCPCFQLRLKDELKRQKEVLEQFFAWQGWKFELIVDLGSGMNSHKKALKRLPDAIIGGVKSEAWASPIKTG
jgi:predicted site-specific integrase-resolvase